MRQIKASEIKPGMTIRWTHNKVTYECPVMDRDSTDEDGGVLCHVSKMHSEYVDAEAGEVTVLSEPQPEEPTEFGARVRVRDGRFVRLDDYAAGVVPWSEKGTGAWWSWDDLCEMGPVTVVPDQGWTVPAEAPEVPERIEEWPEWDKHLRAYEWRDHDGRPWIYSRTHGRWYNFSRTAISKLVTDEPKFGPWTRATDA